MCAYHAALAVALRGMVSAGHPRALPLANSIAAKWLQELNSGTTDALQVLPVLWGLAGLLGVNPTTAATLWQPDGTIPVKFLETLLPLVTTALEKFASSSNHGVCSASVWLMGAVYQCVSEHLSHLERVPQSYDYLPDSSALRRLHAMLQTLSPLAQDPRGEMAHTLLQALTSSEIQLPPVDFSSVLIPFCRNQGLQSSCIDCLLHNCKESQGFRLLASHCCDTRVFTSLKMEQQCKMAENLPRLVASLRGPLQSRYIQFLCALSLQALSQSDTLLEALLKGLLLCFQQDSLSKTLLTAAVSELYRELDSSQRALGIAGPTTLQTLAACLSHGDATATNHSSSLQYIVHCCWVISGDVKFSEIQSSIEWALNNADDDASSGLALRVFGWVLRAVRHCCSAEYPKSLLHRSSLLHTLQACTRATKPSSRKMNAIFALTCTALAQANVSPPTHYWPRGHALQQDTAVWDRTPQAIFLQPDSAKLREKLCQCLAEWLGLADANLRESIFGCFVGLKSCEEYHRALIWTSVAHVL